ncbi:hypothetical protein E6P09_12920 [Haloferax mediterranei ATCC 33500]|uniref:Uncharacterized protein n=1 Tax=Haloferax mediterranei (strain ATCC 33500 / DSM 1411 / JCM 8866 / NBRC 14739 / NCIMB 2177 / R-4) TaxID=523841 RepID=I3R888_HALMT|nr:hypothetical protein [Haloferax mediterranei]AFK20448.1 hypothetical protein HFX_2772 [Haloferax mediterranei ATCC 33500]AHZ23809.1 hypothetical protein BM92_14660 [Haloferax mediterranei ATCC 33500]ELZ98232.1 hypothetical protein C439_15645 [Haloferax mediterranei ATCC 33500]MDX5986796.1 hypothetical protein [Haloferax mediterranei ATCC 33500]QCQ76120.1 hypothetical protein E6P09_12920 [Haloferax mediterranei ATCC 33500]
MADITLFEVHLHDGFEFSPTNRAPFVSKGGETAAEAELEGEYETEAEEAGEESGSKSRTAMALLFGLVLLAGVAAAVRFLRGGDELAELGELDEREEVEVGA